LNVNNTVDLLGIERIGCEVIRRSAVNERSPQVLISPAQAVFKSINTNFSVSSGSNTDIDNRVLQFPYDFVWSGGAYYANFKR